MSQTPDERFCADVLREAVRARTLFPSNHCLGLALAEESGEAVKALLHIREGKNDAANLYNECVQTAAMALRLAVEGDPTATTFLDREPPYMRPDGDGLSQSNAKETT